MGEGPEMVEGPAVAVVVDASLRLLLAVLRLCFPARIRCVSHSVSLGVLMHVERLIYVVVAVATSAQACLQRWLYGIAGGGGGSDL